MLANYTLMIRDISETILNEDINVRTRIGKIEEIISHSPLELRIPLLILYLIPSTNWILRTCVLINLEKIYSLFPRRIQPLLAEILHEQEFHFYPKRAIAANILGRMNDQAASHMLQKILTNTNENHLVRGACAESLAELQIKAIIPVFIDLLTNKFENHRVRAACALGLGWLQAEQAVEPLLANLWDENQQVWLAVVDSLHMFDFLSLNLLIFQAYLRAPRGTKRASSLRELLITRNVLPLINHVDKEHLPRLFDIISQQGKKNFPVLSHLVEQMQDKPLKSQIEAILYQIQPKIHLNTEVTLLL